MSTPSKLDNATQQLTRDHMNHFIERVAQQLKEHSSKLLEIGPQERSVVKFAFINFDVETFDIVDTYKPTYVGNITKYNSHIPESSFDCIACMEVLDQTTNPLESVKELRRILKHKGYLLVSAPLNWRTHGPITDCWWFTGFGRKVLLNDLEIIEIDKLNRPDRNLFPIKYNILFKCDKTKNANVHTMKFDFVN
jgi:SAM-dependent methyltransferase